MRRSRVIEFKLVSGSIEECSSQINKMLEEGWEIHGEGVYSLILFIQPMVRYFE